MIHSIVHAASGATAQVHLYGATVVSYTTASQRNVLFVSRDAKLDGTKAIRGGIPLVFPQFGQDMLPDMPQHGFLRNNRWTLITNEENNGINNNDDNDDDTCATARFELDLANVTEGRGTTGPWSIANCSNNTDSALQCKAVYVVQVYPEQLVTTLTIHNTSSTTEFPFQALLHTYYLVQNHAALDPTTCYVQGLAGYHVHDKITAEQYTFTPNEEHDNNKDGRVTIQGLTDRVYTPPAEKATTSLQVDIGVGAADYTIHLIATGQIITIDKVNSTTTSTSSAPLPVSCVVWNPHAIKAAEMNDFGNDQYHDMICVEPGILNTATNILPPGQAASLQQCIQVVPKE